MKKLQITLFAGLAFALSQLTPAMADLSIRSMPMQAKLGQKATVSIQTAPKALCKLEAQGEGVTQLLALRPMIADKAGLASWTFEINRNFKANKLPLLLTSSHGGTVDKAVAAIDIDSGKASSAKPVLHLIAAPAGIAAGEKLTIKVHSTAGAKLKIEAQDIGLSQVVNLADKTADKNGYASWTFTVSKNYKASCLPIVVTSDFGGAQKKLITAIEVGSKTASQGLPKTF